MCIRPNSALFRGLFSKSLALFWLRSAWKQPMGRSAIMLYHFKMLLKLLCILLLLLVKIAVRDRHSHWSHSDCGWLWIWTPNTYRPCLDSDRPNHIHDICLNAPELTILQAIIGSNCEPAPANPFLLTESERWENVYFYSSRLCANIDSWPDELGNSQKNKCVAFSHNHSEQVLITSYFCRFCSSTNPKFFNFFRVNVQFIRLDNGLLQLLTIFGFFFPKSCASTENKHILVLDEHSTCFVRAMKWAHSQSLLASKNAFVVDLSAEQSASCWSVIAHLREIDRLNDSEFVMRNIGSSRCCRELLELHLNRVLHNEET